jgi:hypothetical protein
MKIIAYTAISGDYPKRDDIPCFTGEGIFTLGVMEAKIYKILPHLFLDCDISIWMDGNIFLKQDPEFYVNTLLGNADIACFTHPYRNSIHQEFDVLILQDSRFRDPIIQKKLILQQAFYKERKLGLGIGLYECGFIIRRHTPEVISLCETWWAEISRWSFRDQVSFPVALEKHINKVKISPINEDLIKYVHFEVNIIPHKEYH